MFLYLSVVLLVSIVQFNPFRPSPSHPSTDSQSFRFSVNFLASQPLEGEVRKYFFIGARIRYRQPANYYIQNDEKLIFVKSIFHLQPGLMAAIPSVQREVTVALRKWLYSNKNQKVAALEFFNSWRYIS